MFSPFCLFILSFVTESCYFGFVAKEKAVALLFLYFYHMILPPFKKLSEFNTIFGEFFFFLDKFRKCCDMQNLKKKIPERFLRHLSWYPCISHTNEVRALNLTVYHNITSLQQSFYQSLRRKADARNVSF